MLNISESTSSQGSVLIIGGGLAGLAAATALAQKKFKVSLIESRPRLGGRATSFVDTATGEEIDNCQHVSMSCCTNFQHLCDTTGLTEHLSTEDQLTFIGPDGRYNKFKSSFFLPTPFHLVGSMRRLSYLSQESQKAIRKALIKLFATFSPQQDELKNLSFLEWLHRNNQPEEAIQRFWNVVLVSALSESLDRIDIGHARKIFFDGFLRNRNSWKVQIPKVPLSELYGGRLKNWLEHQGVHLYLKTGAEKIVTDNDRVTSVILRDGTELIADHFILATPLAVTKKLMPQSIQNDPRYQAIDQIESAPISSVHLWFDQPITDLRHAVLIDRMSQWVFNRSLILENENETDRFAYQIIISASRELKSLSQEEIQAKVLTELNEVFPKSKKANLLHGRVVTEHKAVFSVKPGIEELRPRQQSPIGNFQIAGDWTDTGWPATMEGAVRSGYLAAENILENTGMNEDGQASCLQPDLPAALLTRLIFGNFKMV